MTPRFFKIITMIKLLKHYLSNELSNDQIILLERYLLLLQKWNRAYNLTSITDPKEMVIKHILDSLSVGAYLQGDQVIDVGAGAGLPGIPLAIFYPNKQLTLLDSNGKKTRFLAQAKAELQLNNVNVVHSRVEAFSPEQCFDTVISRAFATISDMLLWTKHLCCPKGVFLAMKGAYPTDEINKIGDQFLIKDVIRLEVPDLNAERHLVRITFG